MSRTHYQTCTLCEAMCGIAITVDGTEITAIKGDKADPFSRGHICPKATALQDLHTDPDRIRQPIARTESGWQPVSWQTAFAKIAQRLQEIQKQYGNDAVAAYAGNPNVHNTGAMLYLRELLRALRTRNKFSATSVDQLPHHIVAYQMYGHQLMIPVPDIDHTDFLLILGGNPAVSNGSIMTVPDVKKRMKAVLERGGEIVVIDPRKTETAALASEHHFIRPGHDVLLLLSMLQVIFEEDLVRIGHLEGILGNWEPLRSHVRDYSPERVAESTGMSPAAIRDLVRRLARAKTSVVYGRMGVSVQQFGGLCQYLIQVINLMLGRVDCRGGAMFTTPAADTLPQTGRGRFGKPSRVRGLPTFAGEMPVATLAEEIRTPGDGQIRALLLAAGNPVLSTPNGQQLEQAIASLDFVVSVDYYINESNCEADFILPPVSPLERENYDLAFHLFAVRNTSKFSEACFPAPADGMHDWQIYLELAHRLQPARSLRDTIARWGKARLGPARMVDLLLRSGPYGGGANVFKGLSLAKLKKHPHGLDLGPLQPVLPGRLFTRTRKIEFALDYFVPDIQRVESTFFQNPNTTTDKKFLLIGRRALRSNNSWLHNSARLVKGKNRCTMHIHPDDAAALSIKDGQQVRVQSRVGSISLPAHVSADLMPGVLSIPHGWGHTRQGTQWHTAESHAGVSLNDLTDDLQIDALTGNAAVNGVPVSVEVCLG